MFSPPQPDEWICYAFFGSLAFAILISVYVMTFIRSTYTQQEQLALKRQIWAIAISVIALLLGFAFRQPLSLILASALWGFAGFSSIRNRIGIVLSNRLLYEKYNRGWSAVITGLVEIAIGILILVFTIGIFSPIG